jgi:peptidoglycan/LPS O-acetylase OafA/YrhL
VPALFVLAVGELILLFAWCAHDIGNAFPFATDYSVPHYGVAILIGMVALWSAYAMSRRLRGRALHVTLAVAIVALVVCVLAYSLYHGVHPAPLVPDGFRGELERATAFHEQLALPVLVTLAGIAAVFGAAATERTTAT